MAEQERDAAETERGSNDGNGSGNGSSFVDALKSRELLLPAALSAVGAVAVSKGPDLVRRLTEATEEKGSDGAQKLGAKAAEGAKSQLENTSMLGKVASKALPGGGGGGRGKKTRRLPIQRWTDVAVPVEKAYDEWLNFEEFPKFMHRVQSVQRDGNNKLRWQEKIWFSRREWEGEITERRKNDRIAWKTTSGMSHYGVVTFHRLTDNLTRVMVDMEFEPSGMIEKMASGLRFAKRAVQADLARFKAHVELDDAKGIEYRAASNSNDDDDDERDNDRRERESRRKERQGAGTGS